MPHASKRPPSVASSIMTFILMALAIPKHTSCSLTVRSSWWTVSGSQVTELGCRTRQSSRIPPNCYCNSPLSKVAISTTSLPAAPMPALPLVGSVKATKAPPLPRLPALS